MKKSQIVTLIIFLVLFLDQALKIWIKTNMHLGEEIFPLGESNDWCRLHFTENPGMAFGLELGGNYGKLALSLFRIVAVGFMIYYLRFLIKNNAHTGLVYSIGLILAGAIGNILDSVFYGLIFSNSSFHIVATMFPEGGGYAGFLHGRVVDMFYFPMFQGEYPEWIPRIGGDRFLFFRPVFNLADSAITLGVILILIFQRRFFEEETNEAIEENVENEVEEITEATTTIKDEVEDLTNEEDKN